MGISIKVTPKALKDAAAKVRGYASDYNKMYTELLESVDTFTRTDYQGDAADAYREQVEGFRDDFDRMRELMDKYAGFLDEAAADYLKDQEEIKQRVKGLQN